MTADPVRVAVWGIGTHARRRVLPAIAASTRVSLIGISTRDPGVRASVASEYGCEAFADPEDMLARVDIDAVYVASPVGLHHEHGRRVLLAGKHLWCEKSLTARLDHAVELVELGRARDLLVAEVFMYSAHPQFRALESLVASALGPIMSVSARFGMPHQPRDGSRYDPARGGSALYDVGCYPLDATMRLLGPGLRVVSARLDFEVETDIAGDALLENEAGARANLEWGYGRPYRNELFLWGERSAAVVERAFSKPNDHRASLVVSDERGAERRLDFEPCDSFVAIIGELADAIRDAATRDEYAARALGQARLLGLVSSQAHRR